MTSASAPSATGGSSSALDRAAAATPGPGSGWLWPVASPRSVLRPFDAPEHEYGAGHRGIDVGARPGTAVASAAAGVVTFAGPVAGRSVVTVDHGGGVVSSFDPVVPTVARGTAVSAGTVIGLLEAGEAMHCADGCLHVGVRVQGAYVDPLPFFAPPERSVLLPLGP
ncbi:peptidoglycan DD-metalloendopeptidase family protein [Labedella endophytica]|uniref:peptidoglycan DD-metalloendopeptidase family protein n=1 Tax=Labedella endophytica TaxID=1523160 RepID=UPI001FB6C95A|nr:peptidoglycan DD-metalloendopeptidase family protein [Labedella endophytica]